MLQEVVLPSSGERTQIIFRRNADISPGDLLELIEKVPSTCSLLCGRSVSLLTPGRPFHAGTV